MSNNLGMTLADCTEYRQTLHARPPVIVHGTLLLVVGLLGAGLAWAALTDANLVVRATGHVRPVSTPRQVFSDFHGDPNNAGATVAIAEVHYTQGQAVRQGDILIRMDTRRLDTEIDKRKLAIRDAEKALAQLNEQQRLLSEQFDKAKAEATAELAQVVKEVERAKVQQLLDVQTAQKELDFANQKLTRARQLHTKFAIADEEFEDALLRARRAEGDLKKAKLEVLAEKIEVYQRKPERLHKDFLLRQMDLSKEQAAKQSELEIARAEKSRLELERSQAILRGPIAGVVTSREPKAGDLPEAGKPIVEIAEQQGFHFELAISSEDVAHLRVGMPARIKLDAYDYQKYGALQGKVCFISPDAKVVENQRVARYAVEIELQDAEVGRPGLRGQVKLGMAGQADVVTDHENLLSLLVRQIHQSISLD